MPAALRSSRVTGWYRPTAVRGPWRKARARIRISSTDPGGLPVATSDDHLQNGPTFAYEQRFRGLRNDGICVVTRRPRRSFRANMEAS